MPPPRIPLKFLCLGLSLALGVGLVQASEKIPLPSVGVGTPVTKGRVVAELVAEQKAIKPGESFAVVLHLQIAPHWHTYWLNPGDSGLPTTLRWTLPPGFTAGAIQWTVPDRLKSGDGMVFGYEKDAYLLTTVAAPKAGPIPEGNLPIKAHVEWLVCQEACVPGSANLEVEMTLREKPPSAPDPFFAKVRQRLPVPNTLWEVKAAYETPAPSVDSSQNPPAFLKLEFTPKPGAPKPPENLTFYPDQPNVLSMAKPASFKTASGIGLKAPLQQNGEKPRRIGGIVVADKPLVGASKAIVIGPIEVKTENASPSPAPPKSQKP